LEVSRDFSKVFPSISCRSYTRLDGAHAGATANERTEERVRSMPGRFVHHGEDAEGRLFSTWRRKNVVRRRRCAGSDNVRKTGGCAENAGSQIGRYTCSNNAGSETGRCANRQACDCRETAAEAHRRRVVAKDWCAERRNGAVHRRYLQHRENEAGRLFPSWGCRDVVRRHGRVRSSSGTRYASCGATSRSRTFDNEAGGISADSPDDGRRQHAGECDGEVQGWNLQLLQGAHWRLLASRRRCRMAEEVAIRRRVGGRCSLRRALR
jgi:hypothetical protein